MHRVIMSCVILTDDLDAARRFAAKVQRSVSQIDPDVKTGLAKAWVDTSLHQGNTVEGKSSAQIILPQSSRRDRPEALRGDVPAGAVATLGNDDGNLYG